MIPKGLETRNIEIKRQPSKSHKIMLNYNFISGKCDNIEAMKQAVYKILNTERYRYVIYSRRYGVELSDLFGKPVNEAVKLIPKRIKTALTQDDRITDVGGFSFDTSKKHVLSVTFTVYTIFGNFQVNKDISV